MLRFRIILICLTLAPWSLGVPCDLVSSSTGGIPILRPEPPCASVSITSGIPSGTVLWLNLTSMAEAAAQVSQTVVSVVVENCAFAQGAALIVSGHDTLQVAASLLIRHITMQDGALYLHNVSLSNAQSVAYVQAVTASIISDTAPLIEWGTTFDLVWPRTVSRLTLGPTWSPPSSASSSARYVSVLGVLNPLQLENGAALRLDSLDLTSRVTPSSGTIASIALLGGVQANKSAFFELSNTAVVTSGASPGGSVALVGGLSLQGNATGSFRSLRLQVNISAVWVTVFSVDSVYLFNASRLVLSDSSFVANATGNSSIGLALPDIEVFDNSAMALVSVSIELRSLKSQNTTGFAVGLTQVQSTGSVSLSDVTVQLSQLSLTCESRTAVGGLVALASTPISMSGSISLNSLAAAVQCGCSSQCSGVRVGVAFAQVVVLSNFSLRVTWINAQVHGDDASWVQGFVLALDHTTWSTSQLWLAQIDVLVSNKNGGDAIVVQALKPNIFSQSHFGMSDLHVRDTVAGADRGVVIQLSGGLTVETNSSFVLSRSDISIVAQNHSRAVAGVLLNFSYGQLEVLNGSTVELSHIVLSVICRGCQGPAMRGVNIVARDALVLLARGATISFQLNDVNVDDTSRVSTTPFINDVASGFSVALGTTGSLLLSQASLAHTGNRITVVSLASAAAGYHYEADSVSNTMLSVNDSSSFLFYNESIHVTNEGSVPSYGISLSLNSLVLGFSSSFAVVRSTFELVAASNTAVALLHGHQNSLIGNYSSWALVECLIRANGTLSTSPVVWTGVWTLADVNPMFGAHSVLTVDSVNISYPSSSSNLPTPVTFTGSPHLVPSGIVAGVMRCVWNGKLILNPNTADVFTGLPASSTQTSLSSPCGPVGASNDAPEVVSWLPQFPSMQDMSLQCGTVQYIPLNCGFGGSGTAAPSGTTSTGRGTQCVCMCSNGLQQIHSKWATPLSAACVLVPPVTALGVLPASPVPQTTAGAPLASTLTATPPTTALATTTAPGSTAANTHSTTAPPNFTSVSTGAATAAPLSRQSGTPPAVVGGAGSTVAGGTATIASIAGSVVAPGSAIQAARAVSLIFVAQCTADEDYDVSFPTTLWPGFRIGDDNRTLATELRGAVVSHFIVDSALALIFGVVLTAVTAAKGTCSFATGVLRFPGVLTFLIGLSMDPLIFASMASARLGDHNALDGCLLAVSLGAALSFAAYVAYVSLIRCPALCEFIEVEGGDGANIHAAGDVEGAVDAALLAALPLKQRNTSWIQRLGNRGAWRVTSDSFEATHFLKSRGMYFSKFVASAKWYYCADIAAGLLNAILRALLPGQVSMCVPGLWAMTVVNGIMLVLSCYLMPYSFGAKNVIMVACNGFTFGAAVLISVGNTVTPRAKNEPVSDWVSAGTYLATIAGYCAALSLVLKMGRVVRDRYHKFKNRVRVKRLNNQLSSDNASSQIRKQVLTAFDTPSSSDEELGGEEGLGDGEGEGLSLSEMILRARTNSSVTVTRLSRATSRKINPDDI